MHWKAPVIGIVLVTLVVERAVSLVAYGAGCTSAATVSTCGSIIIDNTPNPGLTALATNMSTNIGGKSFGTRNTFSIPGIQVMQRQGDTQSDITILVDEIGVSNPNSTSYENFGTTTQLNYFANGTHLFDLDRFRTAADWLAANVSSATGHPTGTYGTISWSQFLDNVANSRTMYGIVRIKVPLKEIGTGRNATDVNNACALDATQCTTIYGFCDTAPATTAGLCSSAPSDSTNLSTGQIRVRGALMFDFVDYSTGNSIELANLPWSPRDIYFKVSVPININAANDSNNDGVMDNINYINSITSGVVCTTPPCSVTITQPGSSTAKFAKVPQEAKDAFNYQFGVVLDQTVFDSLSEPNQYHLLMPSGYPYGWHDAFQELGVTSTQWRALGFDAPIAGAVNDILSVDEIRSDNFEDIPVYIYTGGLVDMHNHVNISGFVYVPQAMELEQKSGSVRQYFMGAVIVRDNFYIEGNNGGGVTLISSDPSSFASVRVRPNSSSMGFTLAGEPGTGGGGTTEPIVGNPGMSTTLSGSGAGGGTAGLKRWAVIQPR